MVGRMGRALLGVGRRRRLRGRLSQPARRGARRLSWMRRLLHAVAAATPKKAIGMGHNREETYTS